MLEFIVRHLLNCDIRSPAFFGESPEPHKEA